MNSKTNYQIALNNNLTRIESLIADLDRQIAERNKVIEDNERSKQTLLEMKAIAREYANVLLCEAVK
jgi:prefoldin subunit 5